MEPLLSGIMFSSLVTAPVVEQWILVAGIIVHSPSGRMRIGHSSHEIATQSSLSVDRAGWQTKMASIEFWIP